MSGELIPCPVCGRLFRLNYRHNEACSTTCMEELRKKCDTQERNVRRSLTFVTALSQRNAAMAENRKLRGLLRLARGHNCDHLHHARGDRHGPLDPCPILARIDAALNNPLTL